MGSSVVFLRLSCCYLLGGGGQEAAAFVACLALGSCLARPGARAGGRKRGSVRFLLKLGQGGEKWLDPNRFIIHTL